MTPAAFVWASMLAVLVAGPAAALDLFTLWRQPEVPLRLEEGAWVEYRSQVMAGGRREQGLVRLAVLDRSAGSDDDSWLLEMVPLDEDASGRFPQPGQGVRIRVSRDLAARRGHLLDAVISAELWEDGSPSPLDRAQLREDPLLAASLEDEFLATDVSVQDPTLRVVEGRELMCDQLVLVAADTAVADLPAGRMIQESSREISLAVHADVPFLGLVYVAERVRSESRLDPPSRRFRPPPPQVRVEVMELLAYGSDARPVLTGPD